MSDGDRVAFSRLSRDGVAVVDTSAAAETGFEGLLGLDLPAKGIRGVRLYDGIRSAAGLLSRRFGYGLRRRAILLITNDREIGSRSNRDQAIEAVLRAGATVNALLLRTKVESDRTTNYPHGAPLTIRNHGVSWQSVKPVIEPVQSRYLLGYRTPPVAGRELRKIEVRLTEPARANAEIRYPHAGCARPATH